MEPKMQVETQLRSSAQPRPAEQQGAQPQTGAGPCWSLLKKIGFRFVFAYLVLFILTAQEIESIPGVASVVEKYHGVWHMLVPWVGKHVLRLGYDMSIAPSGSGDRTYDWVLALCYLVLAAAVAAIWSVLDRKRSGYPRLHQWLRLAVRFSLGVAMIMYGTTKAIPLQMPAPSLARLVEPYGDSSPMGMLWTFIGASRSYEMFTGWAELLGGILVLLPRTTLLGALICFADSTMVFTLNMSYDVPVKLYSLQLLLMGVFLIAPDVGRLSNMFILNRRVEPAEPARFFLGKWPNRIPPAALTALGLCLLVLNFYGAWQAREQYGWLAPKSQLYGIWNVEELSVDGTQRPPLTTDEACWRRLIFQSPAGMVIQPMAGANIYYRVTLNMDENTLLLNKSSEPEWKAQMTFQRPDIDQLIIEGDIDGHQTHARLGRLDESRFLLNNRGFHWVQEAPFNR
jgi:uncharacterized membrane protein YphA (DoxX/SURF4 family)